jgi:hypothetical protein
MAVYMKSGDYTNDAEGAYKKYACFRGSWSICYEYRQEQQDGKIIGTAIKCCHRKINVH